MNRINTPILTAVLALAICSIAASSFTESQAQQGGTRKPACGCYVCGKLITVEFENPGDCAGILAQDACPRYLGSDQASPETRRRFCNHVGLLGIPCPSEAGACNSPNGKNCGDKMPDKGFVFGNVAGGGVHDEPSSNSPTFGTVPKGVRLLYTRTMRGPDGQTWYYTGVPGTSKMGWVPGSNVSCSRPTVGLPGRPQGNNPSAPSLGNSSSAQVAGARG